MYNCPACQDTGADSRGGLCAPCKAQGRFPMRDRVLSDLAALFDATAKRGRLPEHQEITRLVVWRMDTRVRYAAGYRNGDGTMSLYNEIPPGGDPLTLQTPPPVDGLCRKAYIVTCRNGDQPGEVIYAPWAKWDAKTQTWLTKRIPG